MPSDRLFHPRLGHSVKVSSLSDLEYRVWTTYVLAADDFGVLRASPVAIQAASTALEQRPSRTMTKCLDRVIAVDLVRTFTHQGERYLYQPDWQEFQKVRFPARTMQPLPRDADVSAGTAQLWEKHPGGRRTDDGRASDGRPSGDGRATDAQQTDDGRASGSPARGGDRETANGLRLTAHGSTGEESEKGDRLRRAPSRGLQRSGDLQANFARFWAVYPRKVGRDAARRVFTRLAPDNDLTDRMVAAVEQHCTSEQWQKDGGQFIPHPRTWLKHGRWKDEGVTLSAPVASVDLKRLLWRAVGQDGRMWLKAATVTRAGACVRLETSVPDKLAPYHDTFLKAVREELGGDVELAIVAAEAGGA